ncbi:MAG: Cna B-type domain-containing protein, partial [Clostridia bacterium]|nr:Cna B-type domain-containing protein [Clostridia bacterium]
MNGKVIQNAEKFNIRSRRKRRWVKAMSVLGCIVVFCTVYALILPAITMEDSTFCGRDEHIHSEECYSSKMLSCTKAEMHTHVETCYAEISTLSDGHEHNDECYTKTQGELVCTISTEEIHTHTEACFNEITSYICGLEESDGHIHNEECKDEEGQLICELEEYEGHTHGETCIEKTSEKICTLDDTHPHEHSDECYKWEENLSCEITEEKQLTLICTEETSHEHNDECYTESAEPVLVCEIEEHEHSIACHSDVTADVEDSSVWEKTLPELTGDKRDDLLAVAYSQLGYKESVNNYIVTEDGSIKGYTRYGQWYGDTYGDWCAMYVSFCLEYAGIDSIPYDSNCQNWTENLAEMGKYHTEYSPEAGDIIFFDNDADGTSDHVGIVYGFTENGISTIEGNAGNCVCIKEYALDDEKIIGYGVIFDEENEIVTLTGEIYTDSTFTQLADDAAIITLTGAIPEDAVVKAFPVTVDDENALCAYDISIVMPDGAVFEPDEKVNVSIVSPYLALPADNEANLLEVYYVPENGEPQFISSVVTENGISFEADHFSVYMVKMAEATLVKSADELITAIDNNKPNIRLESDISAAETIDISNNISLDLNGHILSSADENAIFNIIEGGIFTLCDSAQAVVTSENVEEKADASALLNEDGKLELTYYVTESEATNGDLNGATTETLTEYKVTESGAVMADGTVFTVNGGKLNLNGGYICSFGESENPAVHVNGDELNIAGTAIITNSHAVYGENSAIKMTDGVISGGEAGICLTGGSLEMSGGYITNNISGIALNGEVTAEITGGYITGNGGGIVTDGNVVMTIGDGESGPYICSNISKNEGGGICLGTNSKTLLLSGYINNNSANIAEELGGGGIYGAEGSYFYIRNAMIAENSAVKLGGGIAGGTTGQIFINSVNGGAVFENTAEESQDYYSQSNSVIAGEMLGLYSANWQGSCDGIPVSASKDDILSSAAKMELSASPSDDGKTAARSLAKLYINGNKSAVNGGGILSDGYVFIGETENVQLGAQIAVDASVELVSENPITADQFAFEITDANTGTVLSEAYNDADGNVDFADALAFTKAGTYTYYIRQKAGASQSNIMLDSTTYRMTAEVVENAERYIENFPELTPETISMTECLLASVKIEKRNGGEWENISVANEEKSAVQLTLTDSPSFVNVERESIDLTALVEWVGDEEKPENVTVNLMRNGEIHQSSELNEENGWQIKWENLPLDENGTQYSYSVEQNPVEGYLTEYEIINSYSTDSETGTQVKIINTPAAAAVYTIDITNISAADENMTLAGAQFNLMLGGELLSFVQTAEGAYSLAGEEDEQTTEILVTNGYGKLVISGLAEGEYAMKETRAPSGYNFMDDMIIEL